VDHEDSKGRQLHQPPQHLLNSRRHSFRNGPSREASPAPPASPRHSVAGFSAVSEVSVVPAAVDHEDSKGRQLHQPPQHLLNSRRHSFRNGPSREASPAPPASPRHTVAGFSAVSQASVVSPSGAAGSPIRKARRAASAIVAGSTAVVAAALNFDGHSIPRGRPRRPSGDPASLALPPLAGAGLEERPVSSRSTPRRATGKLVVNTSTAAAVGASGAGGATRMLPPMQGGPVVASKVSEEERRCLKVFKEGKKYDMWRTESELDRDFDKVLTDMGARDSTGARGGGPSSAMKASAIFEGDEGRGTSAAWELPARRHSQAIYLSGAEDEESTSSSSSALESWSNINTKCKSPDVAETRLSKIPSSECGLHSENLQRSEERIRAKIGALAAALYIEIPEPDRKRKALEQAKSLKERDENLQERRNNLLTPLTLTKAGSHDQGRAVQAER